MGFESGDLSEWVSGRGCSASGTVWQNKGDCHDPNSPNYRQCCNIPARLVTDVSLFDWEARHTMMSIGQDPYCKFPVVAPQLPGYPASKYSLRLGNARPWGQVDQVERTFTVDATNAIFAYQFAFVLNDPTTGHRDNELPFFESGIYDSNGTKIRCSYLKVLANDRKLEQVVVDSVIDIGTQQPMVVRYKKWNPIFINLTDRIGEELTIRFTNSDCGKSGHWGYSYITAYCGEYVAMRDTVVCANEPVTLTSPFPIEGFHLLWSTGDTTEQIIVNPTETTTITLTVRNRTTFEGLDENCEDVYTVNITVPGSVVNAEDVEICAGETATLVAEPQSEVYEWYDALTGGNLLHTGSTYTTPPLNQDTKYYVNNISAECPPGDRTEVNVFVKPSPIPEFTPNPSKATIDNPIFVFVDQSQNGVTGSWDFGDGSPQVPYKIGFNPTHSYYATNDGEGPFKYDITLCLQNELGCEECVVHPIEIENLWSLYIPNSFTPNGDGINDHFMAYGIGILDFDMRVYNRWGEVVFRSDDIQKGWDGTPISGSNKKQDVYVWKVRAKNNRGKVLKYIGHVSLLQ